MQIMIAALFMHWVHIFVTETNHLITYAKQIMIAALFMHWVHIFVTETNQSIQYLSHESPIAEVATIVQLQPGVRIRTYYGTGRREYGLTTCGRNGCCY